MKFNFKRFAAIAILALLLVWYFFLAPDDGPSAVQTGGGNVSQSAVVPEYTAIPYLLEGESGKNEYDANGNLINTADYLTSIGRYTDVLPKGFDASLIPEYCGNAVISVNGNCPFFTQAEIELAEKGYFEYYGPLDSLGRCTVAFDCLGHETMPGSTKRGSISSIHPSGWKQARYDCVDSETVMTRAHLAGYMVSSENANECNLITGTRYMNSDAMLPYEEAVSDYLYHGRGVHVLYRVTPIFTGSNLMADGILMEARSVEDGGKEIRFCVFVYNIQPGLKFNYKTGSSFYSGIFFDVSAESVVTDGIRLGDYLYDAGTGTIHKYGCASAPEGCFHFHGDVTMQKKWSSMGYKTCSCIG